MKQTFKQYLVELMSTGDDNVIGGIIDTARKNLTKLSKEQKALTDICKNLLDVLDGIEQTPSLLYVDSYSSTNYLQRLCNPKVDINTLKTVYDALQSFDGDSDS